MKKLNKIFSTVLLGALLFSTTATPVKAASVCEGKVPLKSSSSWQMHWGHVYNEANEAEQTGLYVEAYNPQNELVGCGQTFQDGTTTGYSVNIYDSSENNTELNTGDNITFKINDQSVTTDPSPIVWDSSLNFKAKNVDLYTHSIQPSNEDVAVKRINVNSTVGVNSTKKVTVVIQNTSNEATYNIPIELTFPNQASALSIDGTNCSDQFTGPGIGKCVINELQPKQKVLVTFNVIFYQVAELPLTLTINKNDKNLENNILTKNVNIVYTSKIRSVVIRKSTVNVSYKLDNYIYSDQAIGIIKLVNKETGKITYQSVMGNENYTTTGKVTFKNVAQGEYKVELYFYHQNGPVLIESRDIEIQ